MYNKYTLKLECLQQTHNIWHVKVLYNLLYDLLSNILHNKSKFGPNSMT